MTTALVNKPSLIERGNLRFLITDAPKENNLNLYLKEFKKYNVTQIVRISEPSYSKSEVEAAGIGLSEMYYPDGSSPPPEIIERWLALIASTFGGKSSSGEGPCIAIHCVAGLGRAPVLVAIALIENGMDAISAVTFIREKRRGAINAVQLNYLESYKRSKKAKGGKCNIL